MFDKPGAVLLVRGGFLLPVVLKGETVEFGDDGCAWVDVEVGEAIKAFSSRHGDNEEWSGMGNSSDVEEVWLGWLEGFEMVDLSLTTSKSEIAKDIASFWRQHPMHSPKISANDAWKQSSQKVPW
jgi:hypothetical protein